MKTLMVFLLLMNVSQHALAMVLEVNEVENSVLLPCQYSGFIPDDLTVMWTRNDLHPKFVHLLREGRDDLSGQNQRYNGRTSIRPDALDSLDFSLTLRKPTKTDSSNYTCSISDGREERKLTDIQLQVKDQQVEVKVEEGSDCIILPCKTTPPLPEDTRVGWSRSDQELTMVHMYPNMSENLNTQASFYRDRTKMNKDLLKTGDLSLTLKYPTERDSGGYICTIYRDRDILRQKVVLQVKEPFPSWATILLVLLGLLVLIGISGGLISYFRQYCKSVYKVEVYSGEESIHLPCKTIYIHKDAKVEWKDKDNRRVHISQNGSDQPEEQHQVYRGRTKMNEDPLKTGDLSLTLKYPTDRDNYTYTCTVYSRKGIILMKKDVVLIFRVPQVEVDSGVESVQLPFNTALHLPEDTKVEWMDSYRKVHVYRNGCDQLEEQNQVYRDRTKMNEDPLKTGDFSLTLKYPTDEDNYTYTSTVYSRGGNILLRKRVQLKVRVCQVEVEEGAESVQLPFKTSQNLPEDAMAAWRCFEPEYKMVHMHTRGCDKLEEQHQVYRERTQMNQELLKTGDLSLTLKHPTERDSGEYRCVVSRLVAIYGPDDIYRYKTVQLKVQGRVQVQDQTVDIKNRSSSIDPTPLMTDQSV